NHFTIQTRNRTFASRANISPSQPRLLFRVYPNTALSVGRSTDPARLQRHESVVIAWIDRDAVRIRVGGDVYQPEVCLCINDAHDWTRGHVACRQVVSVVSRVIPDLVHAANVGNLSDLRPRSPIDHVLVGRERRAVVICATYEEVVARTLSNGGRHAILQRKTIYYGGATGKPAATCIG